jgi:hypothetical protein
MELLMRLLLVGEVEALPRNARHLKRIMKLLYVDLLNPSQHISIELRANKSANHHYQEEKSANRHYYRQEKSANSFLAEIEKVEIKDELQPVGGSLQAFQDEEDCSYDADDGRNVGLELSSTPLGKYGVYNNTLPLHVLLYGYGININMFY